MFSSMPADRGDPRSLTNVQSNLIAECVSRAADQDVSQADVARTADVIEATITRWTQGHWPKSAEQIIRAYAQLLGTTPGQLWVAAAEDWQQPRPGSPKWVALDQDRILRELRPPSDE